jgi:hypothetical protein
MKPNLSPRSTSVWWNRLEAANLFAQIFYSMLNFISTLQISVEPTIFHDLEVWPSGLRRQLQVLLHAGLVRGASSNLVAFIILFFLTPFACL